MSRPASASPVALESGLRDTQSFSTWKQEWYTTNRHRNIGTRIILRMLHTTLAVTFETWSHTAASQGRMRRRVGAIIWQRALRTGISMWKENAKEQKIKRQRSQKVLLRLKHNCLVNCYEMWQRQSEATKKSRSVTARILSRMRNMKLSLMFDTWAQVCSEMNRQEVVLRRTSMKMLSK